MTKFTGIKPKNELPKLFTKLDDRPFQDKSSKKSHLKRNLIVCSVFALIIWSSIAAYGIWSFFDTYSIQSPIVVRSMLVPRHVNADIISPVGTRSAQLKAFNLGAIADKIYTLESSGGKNDSCKNLGLVNGYGWRQNTFEWQCYSTHEEVRGYVIDWLTRHIKNGDIESALCMYNRGIDEKSCTYSMNYLTLK